MTYDRSINFYNINPLLAQPQQMTVGDVEVLTLFSLHSFFLKNYLIQFMLNCILAKNLHDEY